MEGCTTLFEAMWKFSYCHFYPKNPSSVLSGNRMKISGLDSDFSWKSCVKIENRGYVENSLLETYSETQDEMLHLI
jgi:hypothetical protein